MVDNNKINKLDSVTVLRIHNYLRLLGFKRCLIGTTLINKVVQILISTNDEFFNLNEIYNKIALSSKGKLTTKMIREYIRYSIKCRDDNDITRANFEIIFGYEYDEEIFENGSKDFITELLRVFLID